MLLPNSFITFCSSSGSAAWALNAANTMLITEAAITMCFFMAIPFVG
jgi:hypothetical protein